MGHPPKVLRIAAVARVPREDTGALREVAARIASRLGRFDQFIYHGASMLVLPSTIEAVAAVFADFLFDPQRAREIGRTAERRYRTRWAGDDQLHAFMAPLRRAADRGGDR